MNTTNGMPEIGEDRDTTFRLAIPSSRTELRAVEVRALASICLLG